jgi:flagellar assembly protein FliH
VRRALSLVPDGTSVTVRLHPDDHRALVGPGGSTYAVEGRPITVRADADLAPGDAVAEYGMTTVDATIAAAVARVREVLER